VRFIPRESARIDQVVGLARERTVQRHDVGPLEQLVEHDETRAELALPLGSRRTRVDEDLAVEAAAQRRGDAETDPTRADDADRAAVDRMAAMRERSPACEATRTRDAVALGDAPRAVERERDRDLGGRVGEHAGRVRDAYAEPARRVEVDVLVADRERRHHAQRRRERLEQRAVDPVGERAHTSAVAPRAPRASWSGGIGSGPRCTSIRAPGRPSASRRSDDSGISRVTNTRCGASTAIRIVRRAQGGPLPKSRTMEDLAGRVAVVTGAVQAASARDRARVRRAGHARGARRHRARARGADRGASSPTRALPRSRCAPT
jgi:hypothetical protein